MQAEVSSELPLPAWGQILPKEVNCHQYPPPEFQQLGKIDFYCRRDWKSHHFDFFVTNWQTLSQTIIPRIYSSKGSFIFPKNHLFCGLHLHSPSPIKSEYKLSNLTTFGGCLLFSCDVVLKMNESVYLFSC